MITRLHTNNELEETVKRLEQLVYEDKMPEAVIVFLDKDGEWGAFWTSESVLTAMGLVEHVKIMMSEYVAEFEE